MSIIKHVTLQKIVSHDFRYDPRIIFKKAWNSEDNCCTFSLDVVRPIVICSNKTCDEVLIDFIDVCCIENGLKERGV